MWRSCLVRPSSYWLCDASVCGSPGQERTAECESSRAFSSFLRSWHSHHVSVRCCCVTGISDTEAPHHTCVCTYASSLGCVCDAFLGWLEVLVHEDHVPAPSLPRPLLRDRQVTCTCSMGAISHQTLHIEQCGCGGCLRVSLSSGQALQESGRGSYREQLCQGGME